MTHQLHFYVIAAEAFATLLAFAQLPLVADPRDQTSLNKPFAWYGASGVRDQLKLTPTQLAKMNEARDIAWQRYQTALAQVPQGLSADELRLREGKLLEDYQQDLRRISADVFTDPQTLSRFNQLDWQYRGYEAFTDPSVQNELKLTAEQRQRLIESDRAWLRQMTEYRRNYASNRDRTLARFNQSRREIDEGIRSVLSPQQQRVWQELTGAPYEFPADAYFPRGDRRDPGAVTPGSIQ